MNPIRLFICIGILSYSLTAHSQNYVKLYAGTGTTGLVNGSIEQAKFSSPFGMCMDKNRNIYVADNGNNCIRKITPEGIVSTYAGTRTAGYMDGTLAQARFRAPTGVCADMDGNLYVSDFENHRIRKISADGQVTTIAGSGVAGFANGQGTAAQFNYPRGICRDAAGNLYVGDSWNHRIRKITPTGLVSTYAGGGDTIGVQSVGHYKDAADTAARFYTPCEVKIDAQNNVYVADAYTHRIRKIDANRMVTTVAGSGEIGQQTGGFQNGDAGQARFNVPTTVFIAQDGSLYVGDGINQRVRRINNGQVSTFAGSGETGFVDAVDSLAQFNFPRAIVEDTTLHVFYVVDFNNQAIRSIGKQTSTAIANRQSNSLSVFPNPSKDRIVVKGLINAQNELSILDLSGKLVFAQTVQTAEAHIQLPALTPGVYILKVRNQQGLSVAKLVIE